MLIDLMRKGQPGKPRRTRHRRVEAGPAGKAVQPTGTIQDQHKHFTELLKRIGMILMASGTRIILRQSLPDCVRQSQLPGNRFQSNNRTMRPPGRWNEIADPIPNVPSSHDKRRLSAAGSLP
jgi:hypothetical protein